MSDYISKSALIEALEKVHPRVNGIDVFWSAMKVVEKQPTVDEKEIIRKAFKRVVERLEEIRETFDDEWLRTLSASAYQGRETIDIVKRILKEECGISE